ncbi:MAG: hypothetical protein JWL71_4931 [Acidobacteria bacterium]|nr:hypothetical protein [Acidobacteriota bacterium]
MSPLVVNGGFVFVIHPAAEHPANTDCTFRFSVPERELELPLMRPTSVADVVETPPSAQAVAGGLNVSLKSIVQALPFALHCVTGVLPLTSVGPNRKRSVDTGPASFPDLVPLMAAVSPERTVVIALWMVEDEGTAGAGAGAGAAAAAIAAAVASDGAVDDAQADASVRAQIEQSKRPGFVVVMPVTLGQAHG